MLVSELKAKEVISMKDCRKLGHIIDLEFDECNGCIRKIIVPGCCSWFNLFKEDPVIDISYKNIRQIGPDIILVDI